MSLSKSLRSVATAAIVLTIPIFAVCGLVSGSNSRSPQVFAGVHVYEPMSPNTRATGSLTAVETVDLRGWVYTWGSSPKPPPPLKITP